jgi:GxxExxY protein
MHTDEGGVDRITEPVMGGAFQVLNTLGVGFLERVYENALVHELRKLGLDVMQRHGVTVTYDGVIVGAYNVDLLFEGSLIVELKAALDDAHAVQCLNYLQATGLGFCLLWNFGRSRLEILRIAHGFWRCSVYQCVSVCICG